MRRPLPVILSAILLGIFAAFQLLAGTAMVVAAVVTRHKSLPAMPPSPIALPASFLPILFIGIAVFYLALATWFILTLIGLVRLRSWARYSQLVIAALMATFSGFGMVVLAVMPLIVPKSAAPAPSANIMHGFFLFIGAIYAIFTAIGIAQLIYFNRARTRAIFLGDASFPFTPPNTFTGKARPTAITVLSWLFMISAPFCALYAFLPFPAFLFGFTLYGVGAHLVYAVFFLLAFASGYGLYRLRPEGRLAMFAWMGVGFLNLLAFFTPWGSRNFSAYMDRYSLPNAAANASAMHSIVIISCIFGFALNLFILWLLHRHRDAFIQAPPPPPLVPTPYDGMAS